HGSQRIANLVSDRGGHASDRGKAILAARRLFEAANLGQVLKSDNHAGGFARLTGQRRNAVAETKTHAFGSQAVRFKTRDVLIAFQCLKCLGDMLLHLAEKNGSVLSAN